MEGRHLVPIVKHIGCGRRSQSGIDEGCPYNFGRLLGGGESAVVTTKGELDDAICHAEGSGKLTVIEVKIPRDDISPQLATIGLEVARVRGWKPVNAANSVQVAKLRSVEKLT